MVKQYYPDREFSAYIFDFDGTIADTMPAHLVAWNKALDVYGLELSHEQHFAMAGRPTREILKILSDLHNMEIPADEFLKRKSAHYMETLPHVKEIVPVVEIVRNTFGKLPMAVVSGSRRRVIELTLEHLHLSPYFNLILGADDYPHGKPAPDGFLQAAAELNVNAADCLVFEDSPLGIQAAQAAGMECLRVSVHPEAGHEITPIRR